MLKKLLTVAVGTALTIFGVGSPLQAANLQIIASGLESPRGLTFGPDGALYVTEAGRGGAGPCIPAPGAGPNGPVVCYGNTGAITRIKNGTAERIVTGLPSIALPIPEFSTAIDATGIHDIQFDSTGRAYAIFGLGSSPEQRDQVLNVPEFGQLVAIDNLNGQVTLTTLADLAEYEGLFNPDNNNSGFFNPYNDGIDSNPYAFLIKDDTAYIVDAAGNDFFKAKTDGSELTLLSVFPERPITDPFTGEIIAMQSVPTSVAIGPDGAFYISELTGFPSPENAARIFRLGTDNKPEVYADGFTQIIDIAFDDQGGLYVLEYATRSLYFDISPGLLSYIDPKGNRKSIISDGLFFPTALAIGLDGDIYISNLGYIPGQGQVVRVQVSVPEPSSITGLLIFGIFGGVSLLLRQRK
ncbi:ScyD/ScyE family protein [Microcystis sp. BLCC-F210]|uniref:ScyD/ScyE family protein n=1 Tax=Microcystis sp. BLCC-F210 TaxID=3342751 RepID=UPI0035C8EC5A